MRIHDESASEEMTLNLTSLIDVVFLLLIFFMVATTFLDPEREIDLDLPEAESGVMPEEAPDQIVISVFEDGRISLAGRTVDRDGLLENLRQAARVNPTTPVTIRGDRLVAHERIVAVMDACGVAGLSNLAVGTLQTSGG
jgi:biopolymer transport protein ExbD